MLLSAIQKKYNMDISTVKYIVLVTLFVLTFLSTILPLRVVATLRDTLDPNKRNKYAKIVGLLSCFAGGVFMATALLDLLPEVISSFAKIVPNAKFPIGEFVIAFGFFIIFIVEQIAFYYKESVIDTMSPIQRLGSRDREINERETLRSQISEVPVNFSDDIVPSRDDTHTIIPPQYDIEDNNKIHSSFRSVIMFISLSLHSLFEGLAIGIQPDLDTVLQVAIAVIIHKVIIGFSIGLKLSQSDLSVESVAQLDFWFSLMSPIGIGVALAIEKIAHNNMHTLLIVTGIMQGLAAGTFIYVTFFEVLPKEINSRRHRLLKLLSIIIGFTTVCIVIYLDNEKAKSNDGS